MQRFKLFLSVFIVLFAVMGSAHAEGLQLKRVMLSTGGVGYFELEADVDDDANLAFDVKLNQVDDVLKSIVVYDDKGGVGAVTLAGRKPLRQVFRDLPFSRKDLNSPVSLLNALKGEQVKAIGPRQLSGRLISVEPQTVKLPDKQGVVTRYRVSLMTKAGIQEFMLDEAESVQFVDPSLQEDLDYALQSFSEHRAKNRRVLDVELKGKGKRTVRVGYVVEVPLWKTSYRLTVGEGDKGMLQGWAIVENMSGHDWENVELTLVSGNPVTFRQALYTAYYVDRPSVPVEVLGRVLPKPDTGAVRRERKKEKRRFMKSPAKTMALSAPGVGGGFADMAESDASRPPPPMESASLARPAQSQEAATQVLFRFPDKISAISGGTLAVPFINRKVPAKRLSLYQLVTHSTHPLASARLVNDGETGLPPGVITLYERAKESGTVAYVGDAQLATLPAGEQRLISFAVDQKTRISKKTLGERDVSKGAIDRGVLRLTVIRRETTTYHIKAPAREDRTLIIEHPRRANWKLAQPQQEKTELTDDVYRIRRAVAKGTETSFKVVMEKPIIERIAIAPLNLDRVLFYAQSVELSADIREAFKKVAGLRRAVDDSRRRIRDLDKQKGDLFNDQQRIRANLKNISKNSDIYRRYIDKLNAQENQLEDIAEARAKANDQLQKTTQTINAYVAKLKI